MGKKSSKRDPQIELLIHLKLGIPFERISDKIYNSYIDQRNKKASKFGELTVWEQETILTGDRLRKTPDRKGGEDWTRNGNPDDCIEHKNNTARLSPAQKRKKADVESRGGRYVVKRTHIPNGIGDLI